ncbi:MAG: hypothetical protein ACD_3C00223G0009 [uncultured bacterium (gcode 4)]|uniref:DUF2339 domain-containing protein n=1 Tax=uncultured bacterium (gcode 4) TaxID=1234023 RepID=K2FZH6_9BACT|nr:MAG: hypothetical protein ACD_3C00223G0009 [uncultured bacterium (gcode 4)]
MLSISLWLLLSFVLFGMDASYWDVIFWVLFAWIVFSLLIKKFFLPLDFIRDRVVEYTNKVIERTSKWEIFKKEQATAAEEGIRNIPAEAYEQETNIPSLQYEEEYEEEEDTQVKNAIRKESEPSAPSAFERFFAENALAKIWWILLFLWVLFFLGLVFEAAWAKWKLIIWFIAWFAFFGIWVVLDKRWYVQESRTMLWVWILVNYLVILSWRYLIWESDASWADSFSTILSEWMTFFFLILNTIFAITTSLVYKSKTLLLFSFAFAFLNPFLVWAPWDGTPYTMAWYSAIISMWALFLSKIFYDKQENHFAKYLSITWFIGWNILFILAPFTSSFHWSLKLAFIALISILTLFLAYKNNEKQNIWFFLIWAYVAFALMLFAWSAEWIIKTSVAFIAYLVFLWWMLACSVFFITVASIASIWFILFMPLILLLFLLISGSLFMVIPVILWTLLVYLFVFTLVFETISLGLKYLFFILLWVFLVIANLSISLFSLVVLDSITHTSVLIAWFIFLFATYYFSKKEAMSYLFSIWNIGTTLLLLPIIQTKWEFMIPSAAAVIIFAISNMLAPFFIESIRTKDLKNLVISLVAWILFVGWELYNYWEIAKLFPWLILGYCFMWLAASYFVLWFIMMNIVWDDIFTEDNSKKDSWKNAIYSYLWISISLFSLAILIIFATRPAVVASIWFFEATVLYFFFKRLKDIKIYFAACLLFAIWIIKYSAFIPTIDTGEFVSLIPIVFVGASLIINLYLLKDENDQSRIVHDILHIIGIIMVWIGVASIVPHTEQWYVFLALSIVFVIIGFFYNLFASSLLSYTLAITLWLFYINHLFSIEDIFYVLDYDKKENLKYLQYVTVLIPWIWLYSRNKIKGKLDNIKRTLLIPFLIYLFLSTTIFVYDFSDDNVFSITIYWALWAYFYLSNWIKNDLQKWRTIGLYVLALVLTKILLYDVWFGIDDAILRVVALMFVGWLMIYISTMYSKKHPWNLLKEFDVSNLTPDKDNSQEKASPTDNGNSINETIRDIDIGDVTSVTFELLNWKRYMIRSKNLIKISKLIEKNFWKSEFSPWELQKYYDFIINNYKSELSEAEYKKIIWAMKEFVDIWWAVKFS